MCTQAQHPDELSIVEGEELEVLEWDDGDGWCKGKNAGSQSGYLPQSYVQPISRPTSPSASISITGAQSAATDLQLSINSISVSLSPSHSLPLPNGTGEWEWNWWVGVELVGGSGTSGWEWN